MFLWALGVKFPYLQYTGGGSNAVKSVVVWLWEMVLIIDLTPSHATYDVVMADRTSRGQLGIMRRRRMRHPVNECLRWLDPLILSAQCYLFPCRWEMHASGRGGIKCADSAIFNLMYIHT